jgi:DegV family protein with EDD domain
VSDPKQPSCKLKPIASIQKEESMKIAVITDSTSDLPANIINDLGVTVVPLYVNFKGALHKDGIEIKTRDILTGVKEGAAMPSTSQPTPADFQKAYEAALQTHDHVFGVYISSKLSGTLQSAELAARDFAGRVTSFDALTSSLSMGMMVERAVRLARTNSSVELISHTLGLVRSKFTLRFTVGTMDFLRKNGRIGGAQALLGSLLNIKPILHLIDGRIEKAGQARGAQKALSDVLEVAKAYKAQYSKVRASYVYSDLPDVAADIRHACTALGIEEWATNQVGAVVASHVGPGTYAMFLEPVDV